MVPEGEKDIAKDLKNLIYNGDEICPQVIMRKNGVNTPLNMGDNPVLKYKRDYDLIYENNNVASKDNQYDAYVLVKGINDYEGDVEEKIYFAIQRVPLTETSRIKINDDKLKKTIRGKTSPNLEIKDSGVTGVQKQFLNKSEDNGQTGDYILNVDTSSRKDGKISLTITGVNNYSDTLTVEGSYGTDLKNISPLADTGLSLSIKENTYKPQTGTLKFDKPDNEYKTNGKFELSYTGTSPEFLINDKGDGFDYDLNKSEGAIRKDYKIEYYKYNGTDFVATTDADRKDVGIYKVVITGEDNLYDASNGDYYYGEYSFIYEIHTKTINVSDLKISD